MREELPREAPAEFLAALRSLRDAAIRPEIELAEIRAPGQIAPYAVALSGDVKDILPDGVVAGPGRPTHLHACDGRFVLMYDPDGQSSWQGNFRVVVLVRATMDPELAGDPMLPTVMWDWLDEALSSAGATESARGGTVTRALSHSFGVLEDADEQVEVELRASWTPSDDNMAAHLSAWADMLGMAAGLEPSAARISVIK
ncbi:hypothetical protein GCM10010401_23010 [Rarobacter faecitabidus]|uniref:DUF3000 family protein n=1 Tax=Rarobacter faecitabidus TaxID=13243 RepID=A0A542ZW25_RARFA|nr:DUF3000 domain-containing protein [Rarobacter faecitabidus]TQL64557.1 DUF3000 family protein [Rarobacter faecitabidus]